MSQYIEFYVKNSDSPLVEIAAYGHSSLIYKIFCECAPWEKVRELTPALFEYLRANIKEKIAEIDNEIRRGNERIDFLRGATCPLERKMAEYAETKDEIRALEEEHDEAIAALNFCAVLSNMEWIETRVFVGKEAGHSPRFEE